MSVNSRLKATKIINHRKAFYRQRIPEPSCARKETADIAIPVTSRNGDRKIMLSIRITSRPPSKKKKWNQLSQFWKTSTKVKPIKRFKLATFRRWTKGSREAASEGSTVLHIRFCSLSNNSKQHLGAPTQTWQGVWWIYGGFMEIQSNLGRKKLLRKN